MTGSTSLKEKPHGGGALSLAKPGPRHAERQNGVSCGDSASGALRGERSELIRVRKKRKSRKVRKFLIAVLIIDALFIVCAVGALAFYVYSIDAAMAPQGSDAQQLKSALAQDGADGAVDDASSQPFYMLVLGSDAREGDTFSRSDVMILLRVAPENGNITMVSIPRDTKVEIEGHGTQKINAAYAFGGSAGAIEAVSAFAGVPISHYAEIHFDELEELVDDLGGVWVDVPVSNDQTGSSNTGQRIDAGYQLLSGSQALAFARERYGYERGDFQRADNQKLIAQAVVRQVLDQQPIDLPYTISKLSRCITTDFSIADIVGIAQKVKSAGLSFYSATVPSTTETIDGISYTITLDDEWGQMMARVEEGDDPNAAAGAAAASGAVAVPDASGTMGERAALDFPHSETLEGETDL